MARKHHHAFSYFSSSFGIVVGLVLVWRGIWHALDLVDTMFFGGNHIISCVVGVIVGLLILYLPDKNLSELRKL